MQCNKTGCKAFFHVTWYVLETYWVLVVNFVICSTCYAVFRLRNWGLGDVFSAQQLGLLCEEAGNYDNVKYCGYCSYHFKKLVSSIFPADVTIFVEPNRKTMLSLFVWPVSFHCINKFVTTYFPKKLCYMLVHHCRSATSVYVFILCLMLEVVLLWIHQLAGATRKLSSRRVCSYIRSVRFCSVSC